MQLVAKLLPRCQKRVAAARPWIYSNEILMTDEVKALQPGTVTGVVSDAGEWLGQATVNPHALICGRIVTRDRDVAIDHDFLVGRLDAALRLRDRFFDEPYYRLANSEADGLPGVIIDRYGPIVSIQLNRAGADRLKDDLLQAIESVLSPETIVLRNDSAARSLEGLNGNCSVSGGYYRFRVRFQSLLRGRSQTSFFGFLNCHSLS